MRNLLISLPILILAASCGHVSEQPKPAATPFSFREQLGWLQGPCLAISNPNLARGTSVTLVITGEPQKVQQSKIQEPTTSSEMCAALLQGRAKINAKPGMSFYALEAGGIESTDMGFGIVAPAPTPTVVNGLAQVDLNQDGHPEVFSSCATSEGIKLTVWTAKAYQGEPLWSAYNYLDYDMKPTCP